MSRVVIMSCIVSMYRIPQDVKGVCFGFVLNRTYMRHQATSPTDSLMPSTTGNGKWRDTRNKIHPSSTSTNSLYLIVKPCDRLLF